MTIIIFTEFFTTRHKLVHHKIHSLTHEVESREKSNKRRPIKMKWNENGSLIKVCLLQSQVCLCFWVLDSYYVEFWFRWSLLFFYNFEFFVLSFFISVISLIFLSVFILSHSVFMDFSSLFLFFLEINFLFTFTFWALYYKISLQYSGHCSVINQAKW